MRGLLFCVERAGGQKLYSASRLALSRVDATFAQAAWTAVLPFAELSNRWELGSHLLWYGDWNVVKAGVTTRHEGLVSLDLASGRWQGWDTGADAKIEVTARSSP